MSVEVHWLEFVETRAARRLGVDRAAARRLGVDRAAARRVVARDLREPPGTLENVLRGRVKRIAHETREKIRLAFIRSVERKIGILTNELAAARLGHGDTDARETGEIATHLEALRAIVARRRGVTHGEG